MKTYELTVVYSPNLSEIKLKKELKALEMLVDKCKGKVMKADHWGKKNLAYPIQHQSEGYFAFWRLQLPPEGPQEMTKEMKANEAILRYLFVRKD